MIVEAALTNCDGARRDLLANARDVARGIEFRGVMRMHAGGMVTESRMRCRNARRAARRRERLANADDGRNARLPRAGNDVLAIGIEGRIGKVSVAVDERRHGYTNRRVRRRSCRMARVVLSGAKDLH